MRNGVTLLILAAVGVIAAIALADTVRSVSHSSAPPTSTATTRTDAQTVEVVSPPATRRRVPKSSCGAFRVVPSGGFPLLIVSVVAGEVTCHDARDLMKAHYVGLERDGWSCHGPDGSTGCEKPSGEAVSASFADPLTSPEVEIEEIANRWARGFSAHGHSCSHMTQPGCERVTCVRVGPVTIPNCMPVTIDYRRSFGRARVEEIAFKGGRIAARFSNGELVEIVGVAGGEWMIHRVGWEGSARVFE